MQPQDGDRKGADDSKKSSETGSSRNLRSHKIGQASISASIPPARLGFAVKVMGKTGLRSHDTRRWQNSPHLRVSLDNLEQILSYLSDSGIGMYRMASGLAPYATHPDHPEFHNQIDDCLEQLERVGAFARLNEIRLSFHPGQFIVINSTDEDVATRSLADIELHASILAAMGLGDEAVIVTHIGGVYGDRQAALARFAWRTERLSRTARRRLVVENDDRLYGVDEALLVHKMTGIRVVFDAHHHHCYNPLGISTAEAARMAVDTWRGWEAQAKVHYSSPRTDWGLRDGNQSPKSQPTWRAHAEFIDPFSFINFYRQIADRAPDVMLEAKAKDLALIQLRQDLERYAPDLYSHFQVERQEPMRETQAV